MDGMDYKNDVSYAISRFYNHMDGHVWCVEEDDIHINTKYNIL